MAAYIIGHIRIMDPEKWHAYRSRVGATFAAWGGELVFRGEVSEVLNGVHPQTDTVVARFPDKQAIRAWHDSPEYQALIPLRDAGAEVVLISVDATA